MSEPIRSAATVIVLRRTANAVEVLMGQRGEAAVFMPSKFVFPGGRIDPEDQAAPDASADPLLLSPGCRARLTALTDAEAPHPGAVLAAALRELSEETGLALAPNGAGPLFRFIFRAITPPGRSRRFDARFLLADAPAISGDATQFSAASGELAHLRWLPLSEARALDLPFITEVVLAEVAALAAGHLQPGVPFFDNSGATPAFRRLL
jgi:8-oxo-dGTP pyrophosphatase MutT (NUDIX family)